MQIVHASRRGARDIEHPGSAHDEAELEALKAAAQQRILRGQDDLDLGLGVAAAAGPLEIVSSRMGHLWDALWRAYDALGFTDAMGGDAVFRDLVLARVIEPTSKLVSLRVLSEAGIDTSCYATLKRRLPAYAEWSWRQDLAGLPRSEPNLVRACLCQHARPRQRWASPSTLQGAAYSRHAQVLLGVIVPTPDEAAPRARRGCPGRRLRT